MKKMTALAQAVEMAMEEMRPQLKDIDVNNKKDLEGLGMTMVEYDDAFFDEILALDTVKALYADIDKQINGLGTMLQEELAK